MREPRIFICYRTSDTYLQQRVSGRLRQRFGADRVIIGPSSEPEGLSERIESCDVLIPLVGQHFLRNREGHATLASEDDYMREAIGAAFRRGLHVIPLLLPNGSMPGAEDLPADLQQFASLKATKFGFDTWKQNSDILIDIIEELPPKSMPTERTQTPSAMPISVETLIERAERIRAEGRRFYGHKDHLTCLAFSSDSRLLASGSYDQTVRLWEVQTGRLLWTQAVHSPMPFSVAFSPDGRLLACTGAVRDRGAYGDIWLLDVKTGEPREQLEGHASYVNCVAFSPDGRILASASNDRAVNLHDLKDSNREHTQSLLGHTEPVWHISFSPDGEHLASASRDGTVRIWSLPNRSESRILKQTARMVAFSPDGRMLASAVLAKGAVSGAGATRLVLTEVKTGRTLRELQTDSELLAVAWTPDASIIAARLENQLQLIHAESGRMIYQQHMWGGAGGRGYVRPLCVSPDGRFIASFAGSDEHALHLWDISALDVGPEAWRDERREVVTVATRSPLDAHLRTLPLSHAAPPTPARPAHWLRSAAATGARPPLAIVRDFGALLTQPRSQLSLERPAHLPQGVDTTAYHNLLTRLAAHPLLREVSSWDISDAVAGVIIARLTAGLSFSEIYSVPSGAQAAAFAQRLGTALSKADAGRIWRETEVAERPNINQLLPAEALARIEANLWRLDGDELRFLHRYGPRFAGTPDPREMLDLFNLLDLPPNVRLALTQVLRLLPRVSQSVNKGGGMQTYAMGGYAGLTHRGSLDSLLPTELAYPSQMLLHRLLNQEALYYGRESEQERQREVAYIVTQAGLDVRGDVDVLARALTLALVQAMQGRGYEVQHSFVGSHWTEPAEMSRPADVQRVLYYRDEGSLRAREMLAAVLGQLRGWRERYRGLHLIWVVGEHWDADEREENQDLYTALKTTADQQAWFIRLGGPVKAGLEEPVAARDFGRVQIVNSDVMWARNDPPVMMYVPPEAAEPEPEPVEVELGAQPQRVMLVCSAGPVGSFLRSELHARGHMVMADSSLTNEASWRAALRNVDWVIPFVTARSSWVGPPAVAARVADELRSVLKDRPRVYVVRINDGSEQSSARTDGLFGHPGFVWRSEEDNEELRSKLVNMFGLFAPGVSFDGLYATQLECVDWAHPEKDWSWRGHCLKFTPDNKVIHSMTWGRNYAADFVFTERDERGTYSVRDKAIEIVFTLSDGKKETCKGAILDNDIMLSGTFAGHYHFTAVPGPKGYDKLRFDGVYTHDSFYINEVHPERNGGWDRFALRFRSDGTVSYRYAFTGYDEHELLQPDENDPQGTYRINGTVIEILMRSSSGETRDWHGTIEDDSVTLTMSDGVKKFSFVAD